MWTRFSSPKHFPQQIKVEMKKLKFHTPDAQGKSKCKLDTPVSTPVEGIQLETWYYVNRIPHKSQEDKLPAISSIK